MSKKSQAALEFMMTYGWAIFVVLMAVGALVYSGVLSPDKFLLNRCILPAGIACLAHKADSSINEIDVTLKNGLGYDITSVSATASGCTTASSTQPKLRNGEQKTFAPSECTLTGGKKYSGQLNITYTDVEGISHKMQGKITTKAD